MTFVYGFIFETFEEKFMNVLEFVHIIFFMCLLISPYLQKLE